MSIAAQDEIASAPPATVSGPIDCLPDGAGKMEPLQTKAKQTVDTPIDHAHTTPAA